MKCFEKYIFIDMEAENISKIVSDVIVSPDLDKLSPMKGKEFWKNQFKAALNLVPGVGGALAQELQNYEDFRLAEFFRKFTSFILELTEVSADDRVKFANEVQEKAEDMAGNVISGMVDRLDNINKEKILASLTKARIHGSISLEDYFRLSSLLERIPYVDLKYLPYYKEPYYDESGDSELLYATGALVLHTIDANESSKYILSTLGEKLLEWGCNVILNMERNKGTNMALDTVTDEEIDEIVNGKVEKAVPKVVDEALQWENY